MLALSSGLALREDQASVFFTGLQEGLFGPDVPMPNVPANIWASEVTLPAIRAKNAMPDKVDVLEVEFVSQASTSSDAISLTGKEFDVALARYSKAFHENFAKKFPHDPKAFSDKQVR